MPLDTEVAKKILLGINNITDDTTTINVNLKHPFSFNDEVESHQHDFKDILIHEITHALGFISRINCSENTCHLSKLD